MFKLTYVIIVFVFLSGCSGHEPKDSQKVDQQLEQLLRDNKDMSEVYLSEQRLKNNNCYFNKTRMALKCESKKNIDLYNQSISVVDYINNDLEGLRNQHQFGKQSYISLLDKQSAALKYAENMLNKNVDLYDFQNSADEVFYKYLSYIAFATNIYIKNDRVIILQNSNLEEYEILINNLKIYLKEYKDKNFNFPVTFDFEKKLEKLEVVIKEVNSEKHITK